MEKTEWINHSCITCQFFAWWDGDYCCVRKAKLLQESPDGKFTKDILMSLKINKNCAEYDYNPSSIYKEDFDNFLNSIKNV